jgi:predicted nucleic acid-binding protein
MNVLVDTSVWVEHFQRSNRELMDLIGADRVLGHPMVVAEIACGSPPAPRETTLGDMALLRQATQATQEEVMQFIESHRLYGQGVGFVDVNLLISACITPDTKLWTRDKRLAALASKLNVAHTSKVH